MSGKNSWDSPEEERPWPTYGSSDRGGSGSGYELSNNPSYGQASGGEGSQSPYSPQGSPDSKSYLQPGQSPYPPSSAPEDAPYKGRQYGSAPQGGSPYGASPYGAPAHGGSPQGGGPYSGGSKAPMELPSRTGPILGIVGGVVLMVVVAPIIMFAMVLTSVGITTGNVDGLIAFNGGEVTVDESGAVGFMSGDSDDIGECVLEGPGGTHRSEPELEGAIAAVRGVPSGTYTVECEGVRVGGELVVLNGEALEGFVPNALKAFGFSSVVGVIGFVTLIGSIIWLTKRNRARREVLGGY